MIPVVLHLTDIVTQSSDDLLPGDAGGAEEQHVEGGQDGDRGEQGVPRPLLHIRAEYFARIFKKNWPLAK